MRINHNISALNAWRNLSVTDTSLSKSLEKLSSGLRINRAADDAAGLAISEKMRAQIRGLDQAVRNAQDGISLLQTAEGALNETHSILQRIRELADQAANDTNTLDDRRQIQREINQLVAEIDRISTDTEFNTQKLLDGTFSNKSFQIGPNPNQSITLTINNMGSESLGGTQVTLGGVAATWVSDIDVTSVDTATQGGVLTVSDANAVISIVDEALNDVSTERSKLGALQNRLEHTIANLSAASENLAAAESRIRDVDMAQEMMALTRAQILMQAGTAMLAQANLKPQSVLQLLG